jgi:hypothetical protein
VDGVQKAESAAQAAARWERVCCPTEQPVPADGAHALLLNRSVGNITAKLDFEESSVCDSEGNHI